MASRSPVEHAFDRWKDELSTKERQCVESVFKTEQSFKQFSEEVFDLAGRTQMERFREVQVIFRQMNETDWSEALFWRLFMWMYDQGSEKYSTQIHTHRSVFRAQMENVGYLLASHSSQ